MAKRYTSKVQVNIQKQHTCAGCGAVYTYDLSRKAVGSARNPDAARRNMQKRVQKITENETDMHPCPACGLYQYDMIAQRRAKSRIQFFLIALAVFVAVLILRAAYAFQSTTLTWISVAVAAFIVLAQLLLETQNKNRDLTANQSLAQQRLEAGTLRLSPAQTELNKSAELAMPSRGLLHLIALLILVLSVPFIFAPTLMCVVHHWPINDTCYPPVVGPTDQTRIYLPEKITSIKGYWRGNPTVQLNYEDNPSAAQQISAVANQNNWGSTIDDVKSGDDAQTSHPWVEVTLPDDSALAGKTVTCDIDLSLEYPQMQGSGNFRTISEDRHDNATIHLTTPGAGQLYNSVWWLCTAAGGGAIALASLLLYYRAKAFGRLANPTQVFQIAPAEK